MTYKRKVEQIIYYLDYFKGKRAQNFAEKLKTRGVKVFEDKISDDILDEYYYYKDLHGKHHFIIIHDNFPDIEIIIDADITTNEFKQLNIPPTKLKNITNIMLKIPELQILATEIILTGVV